MENPQDKPQLSSASASFFGLPASWHLWARVGPTFWGGLLAGLGLGLFAAKFLDDLHVWKSVWVGFVAIILVGIGPGIAIRAVRRNVQQDQELAKDK